MLVFTVSVILTIAVALLQTTNWLLFGPVLKPNLILITLIILSLINESWTKRFVLILTASLILKFTPGFSLFDFVFLGAALLAIILTNSLPWQEPVNLLLATLAGTVIINLASLHFPAVIYEIILNLFLALILFTLLKLVYVPKIQLQGSRF